ncbi:MAG: hypothetical protein HRT40_12190 [Campylobacteraceae bacterium]|nr:hypothetical protein [Campylobacteraceae bacterium]
MHEKEWKNTSKNILKSELRRKNIDYNQLSEKLTKIGIDEPSQNINSKINRGTFSFIFFLQCMEAIETNNITLRIRENINE